jgi:hypothetical protein
MKDIYNYIPETTHISWIYAVILQLFVFTICATCNYVSREIYFVLLHLCGSGNSVGIATGYGLDGPGIESRWGRDFPHLSIPALGPNRPPIQWVAGLSRG